MRTSGKKLMAAVLTLIMVIGLLSACGGGSNNSTTTAAGNSGDNSGSGETIKLGWMGSLTGEQAAYGICESQTLKMLVEEKNAAGGILGKQIELICHDTKGDAQEAVNVARRLCAQDKVCAIIGPNAAAPCYQGGTFAKIAVTPDAARPLEAIQARYAGKARVDYEPGVDPQPRLPSMPVRTFSRTSFRICSEAFPAK